MSSISGHFSLYIIFRISLRSSYVRCKVPKFISEFASRFVNKGYDWPLESKNPIKCLVYKLACEFWNELLDFITNFQTSQRNSEYYIEKLAEIDDQSGLGYINLHYDSLEVLNCIYSCEYTIRSHTVTPCLGSSCYFRHGPNLNPCKSIYGIHMVYWVSLPYMTFGRGYTYFWDSVGKKGVLTWRGHLFRDHLLAIPVSSRPYLFWLLKKLNFEPPISSHVVNFPHNCTWPCFLSMHIRSFGVFCTRLSLKRVTCSNKE